MKICSVGIKLFHADRRTDGLTDMTKLIDAFRNFASAPQNCTHLTLYLCVLYLSQKKQQLSSYIT
jgi:hypothetical protein